MGDRAAQDIRLTFDRVPQIYEGVRPTYPAQLFDRLFERLPDDPTLVEVGPGAGQATGDLLRCGARITAVELGEHLAGFLADKFIGEPKLKVVHASFEDAPLESKGFDGIVCATAYHWIPADQQIQRPLQLLRPGGVLAIIDLVQVDSSTDRGYFERVQAIYDSFDNGRSDWTPKTYENAQPQIANHLRSSGRYHDVVVHRVPWDQTYSSAQYRDLLLTYSGTQMMAEPERSDMVDQLIAVVDDEFDGAITRPLVATLTLASAPI